MHYTAQRLGDGGPLRDAIQASGLTLQGVSDRTVELDPAGNGISYQLVAFLRSPAARGKGRYRETTTPETAGLIAAALGVDVDTLFTKVEVADRGEQQPALNGAQ